MDRVDSWFAGVATVVIAIVIFACGLAAGGEGACKRALRELTLTDNARAVELLKGGVCQW